MRTQEEIIKHLQEAKLDVNDMYSQTQCIYFASTFTENSDKYLLLEADGKLLKEFENVTSLQFKGDDDDNVVLTTADATYDVVMAETSNSVCIVKDLAFKDDLKEDIQPIISKVYIHKIAHQYLELLPGRPYLQRLHKLLENSIYKGPELEYEIQEAHLYTYDMLLNEIQASDLQLKQALKNLLTIELNGFIRTLNFEYHFRVLSLMLKLIEENSWDLNEVDYDTTINSLSDLIPLQILDAVFNYYTEESKMIDAVQLYQYKEDKICKFFARVLLSSAGKFNLNEFLQAWSESVPEGMTTTEDMLHGIGVIDRTVKPNVIWYLDENNLPESIEKRLSLLFEKKNLWTTEEIAPFLE